MRAIVKKEVIDLAEYAKGFVYIKASALDNGSIKASFYAYNQLEERRFPITKKEYLQVKFGPYYEQMLPHLDDFIFCSVTQLAGGQKVVLYEDGRLLLFTQKGKLAGEEQLQYNGDPICCAASQGQDVWGIVPMQNAVVRYSFEEKTVMLRIGGGNSQAFYKPSSLFSDKNRLYICSPKLCKIRTIDLSNYAVRDYCTLPEPVYRYVCIAGREYVLLQSGLYLL